MTLVSSAESLSVQLVTSYSYVLLGDPQHADRTKSGVCVYVHTSIQVVLLCDTTKRDKRKEIKKI